MRPTERLLDQLNRAFGGEAWHGPALRNLLDGVTETQAKAKAKPIRDGHSILELVVHIETWIDVVAKRVEGNVVDSNSVDDWADVTKTSWPVAVRQLEKAESRLCDAVARLNSDDLDKPLPGEKKRSVYGEIMGVLQHNVYHAGQIAILKKAN
ncbi:MAG TPA: DinB family protein [Thermoanaerobaculia bacterium]|nr:DinB family protein [Thermoanaerobaculia bacterium]